MPRRCALLPVLVVALLVGGCDDPSSQDQLEEPGGTSGDAELAQHLERALGAAEGARTVLFEVAADLEQAAGAFEIAEGSTAAERAVRGLTSSPTLIGEGDGSAEVEPDHGPFLPAESDDQADDVLNETVAAAREAGEPGARLLALLDDPVVGDVTGWQQDPASRNDDVREAVRAGTDVAVDDLGGQVPRALAWGLIALRAGDEQTFAEDLERASAHLAVAIAALDGAIRGMEDELEEVEGTGTSGPGGGSGSPEPEPALTP